MLPFLVQTYVMSPRLCCLCPDLISGQSRQEGLTHTSMLLCSIFWLVKNWKCIFLTDRVTAAPVAPVRHASTWRGPIQNEMFCFLYKPDWQKTGFTLGQKHATVQNCAHKHTREHAHTRTHTHREKTLVQGLHVCVCREPSVKRRWRYTHAHLTICPTVTAQVLRGQRWTLR